MRFSPAVTEEIQTLSANRRWRRSFYSIEPTTITTAATATVSNPDSNPPQHLSEKPCPTSPTSLHLTEPTQGSPLPSPPSHQVSPRHSSPKLLSPVSPPYMFLGHTIVQQPCKNGNDDNVKTKIDKDKDNNRMHASVVDSGQAMNENVVSNETDSNENTHFQRSDEPDSDDDDSEQFFDVEDHEDRIFEEQRNNKLQAKTCNLDCQSEPIKATSNASRHETESIHINPKNLQQTQTIGTIANVAQHELTPPRPRLRHQKSNKVINPANISCGDVRADEHLVLPPPPTIRYHNYLFLQRRSTFRRLLPVFIAILVATTLLLILTSTLFTELEKMVYNDLLAHQPLPLTEAETVQNVVHHTTRRLSALVDEQSSNSSSRYRFESFTFKQLHGALLFHIFPFLRTFLPQKKCETPHLRSRLVTVGETVRIGLPQASASKIRYGIVNPSKPLKGAVVSLGGAKSSKPSPVKKLIVSPSQSTPTQQIAKVHQSLIQVIPSPSPQGHVPILAANLIHIDPDSSGKPIIVQRQALSPIILNKKGVPLTNSSSVKGNIQKPLVGPPTIQRPSIPVDLQKKPTLPPYLATLPLAGALTPGIVGNGLPFGIQSPLMKQLETIEVWHLPHGKFLCQIPNAGRTEDGQIIVPKWMEKHKEFLSEHCGLTNCVYGIDVKGPKIEIMSNVEKQFKKPLKLDMRFSEFDLFSYDAPREHMPHFVSDIIKPLIASEVLLGSGRTILIPFTLHHVGGVTKLNPSVRRLFWFKPALLMLPETWKRPETDWVQRLARFFKNPALGFTIVNLDPYFDKDKDEKKPLNVRMFQSIITSNVNPYEPYGLFGTTGKNIVFAANGISRDPPWALRSIKERPCHITITALTRSGPRALLGLDVLEKAIANRAKLENIRADFRVVDFTTMSFDEQVRTMQETHILIATHGAGNANIIFMRPGAAFVEVFPFSYKAGPFDGFARIFGLEYSTAMSAPQTDVFKSCLHQHEKNDFIRKLVLKQWDDAVKEEAHSPWVHRLEFEKEFGEPGKSQGLATRGCVRMQQLKFNIDAVTDIAIRSGRSQCYLGSLTKT